MLVSYNLQRENWFIHSTWYKPSELLSISYSRNYMLLLIYANPKKVIINQELIQQVLINYAKAP